MQKDVLGENEGSVILNVFGDLADPAKTPLIVDASGNIENPTTGDPLGPLMQRREIAKEGNLLLLGIPSTLPT